METKFTPGPWSFSRWEQFGDTRFYIAQADGAPYTPNYSDVATLIAETVSSEYVRIQEANARLIATAPELFEALLAYVQYTDAGIETDEADCGEIELAEKARAVLAKATGEV